LLEGTDGITLPRKAEYSTHVYHIYAVRARERARLLRRLAERKIGFMVNYPMPLHLQPAYRGLRYGKGDFPRSERVCREIVSLPIHPFITCSQVRYVAQTLKDFYAR
jgi:dTDP-4-amino-4,6-dideoxygalactose transaminase